MAAQTRSFFSFRKTVDGCQRRRVPLCCVCVCVYVPKCDRAFREKRSEIDARFRAFDILLTSYGPQNNLRLQPHLKEKNCTITVFKR